MPLKCSQVMKPWSQVQVRHWDSQCTGQHLLSLKQWSCSQICDLVPDLSSCDLNKVHNFFDPHAKQEY